MNAGQAESWGQLGPYIAAQDGAGELTLHAGGSFPHLESLSFSLAATARGSQSVSRIQLQPSAGPAATALTDGWLAQCLTFQGAAQHGLTCSVLLGWLAPKRLLWQAAIHNPTSSPATLDRLTLHIGRMQYDGPGTHESPDLAESRSPRAVRGGRQVFFHNGWQSWSHAGWLAVGQAVPTTRLGRFTRPMQLAQGFTALDGAASSDMYTVVFDPGQGRGWLAGFLSQSSALGQVWLRALGAGWELWYQTALDGVLLEPGETFTTDWACLEPIDEGTPDPAVDYLRAVARLNHARSGQRVPPGWCSWYYYYGDVGEQDIFEHIDWAAGHQAELPLGLLQLDDGFQQRVGDWYDRAAGFPAPLQALSSAIHDRQMQAGLWLAPFLAHPRSNVVREHPEWILRDHAGKPVNPGWGWNSFPRVLDVTHPQVLEHLRQLIRTAVHDWGFEYLKLDFLYAGALPGAPFNRKLTRAQAFVQALRAMRSAAGERAVMVGCGSPLGSAIGELDAMRIGPDVAPTWHPRLGVLTPIVRPDPGFPAVRNAIRNTLARSGMHNLWWVNDPDCLLLREDESYLSAVEVQTLATAISLTAGSHVFSDRMPSLSRQRLNWASRFLPMLGSAARDLTWREAGDRRLLAMPLESEIGAWQLLALFNLGDEPTAWRFDRCAAGIASGAELHCLDFWRAGYSRIESGAVPEIPVEPHGCRLFAVRPIAPGPGWIGSDLHISQGLEVCGWSVAGTELSFRLGFPGRRLAGSFWLKLPGRPLHSRAAGANLEVDRVASGVYRFQVALEGRAEVTIAWAQGSHDD